MMDTCKYCGNTGVETHVWMNTDTGFETSSEYCLCEYGVALRILLEAALDEGGTDEPTE